MNFSKFYGRSMKRYKNKSHRPEQVQLRLGFQGSKDSNISNNEDLLFVDK